MGIPANIKSFTKYEVEGMEVYINYDIKTDDNLRIRLSNILWVKSLVADGVV